VTIRVLIADDQPVVRDGLAMLLGLLDDVEIVATAADGIEAVERACSERPSSSSRRSKPARAAT
jgi:DNA-binding NarL/FixJ family response regulator